MQWKWRMIVCMLTYLALEKNDHRFADDIFRCIFVIEKNISILIKISPKFVTKGQIDNNPAVV